MLLSEKKTHTQLNQSLHYEQLYSSIIRYIEFDADYIAAHKSDDKTCIKTGKMKREYVRCGFWPVRLETRSRHRKNDCVCVCVSEQSHNVYG